MRRKRLVKRRLIFRRTLTITFTTRICDPDGTLDAAGKSVLKPLELTPDEIRGRNTWVLWCAGDEVFWDYLAGHSYGFLDLLKLCDFAPNDKLGGKRFGPAGITIEPDTKVPDKPDEFGLFIRQPQDAVAPEPDPKIYGRSSGIVGLRLFPNPKFDEKARKHWDAVKYRRDENYYNDPNLVRPYRVGNVVRLLSCWAASLESAGRSGSAEMGKSFDNHRCAIFSHACRIRKPAKRRQFYLSPAR